MPCPLIAEALGARHGHLGLTDYSVDSEDWTGTDGFGLKWLQDSKTRACWNIMEQSGRFSCMGSPLDSSPPCPERPLVEKHRGAGPPKTD